MKISISIAIRDLADEFLCEIVKQKTWSQADIIAEFQKASYNLALVYFDKMNEEEKK